MASSDTRIALDADNRDRYTKWAGELSVSREWLINHLLRMIGKAIVSTDLEMKTQSDLQVGRRRLIIKKNSRSSQELL